MKRRRLLKTMLAGSAAAPVLYSQQTPPANSSPTPNSPTPPPGNAVNPPAPYNQTPPPAAETPKLETATADEAGDMSPKFLNPDQYAALRKLSEIIMPAMNSKPGAVEADVPEFLDFYISQAPEERKQVYRAGLDALNAGARKQFGKTFANVDATEAGKLLAPLREEWTYDPPKDPLTRFLRQAKQDIRAATLNSREYATAASAGSRRAAGIGLYWYSLD